MNYKLNKQKSVKKEWYAFYTQSNSERTVKENLERNGIEVFLPVKADRKIWRNGKISVSDKVLFNNYLFAKVNRNDADFYSRSRRVIDCVRSGGKPEPVCEELIHTIRCMIKEDAEVDSNPMLYSGKKVKILNGRLTNCVGYLSEQKGKYKFCIEIYGTINTLIVTIDLRKVTIQELSD